MNKKQNLTTEEKFALAIQNHKKNNLQIAKKLYNETLKANPYYEGAHNNLGILLNQLGEYQKAISAYKKAIQIAQEVFPYDFFYMQWKGYDQPEVANCQFFDEPIYDYHNLLETKYKPDCHIWRRYTRPNTGKIFLPIMRCLCISIEINIIIKFFLFNL